MSFKLRLRTISFAGLCLGIIICTELGVKERVNRLKLIEPVITVKQYKIHGD